MISQFEGAQRVAELDGRKSTGRHGGKRNAQCGGSGVSFCRPPTLSRAWSSSEQPPRHLLATDPLICARGQGDRMGDRGGAGETGGAGPESSGAQIAPFLRALRTLLPVSCALVQRAGGAGLFESVSRQKSVRGSTSAAAHLLVRFAERREGMLQTWHKSCRILLSQCLYI